MNIDHDVVVIGAGFSGLYAVHKMRDELGLTVQGFEAADGVGGTWWWNRYPGARCDFESVHYSYSFSEELKREWQWSQRFAAQPEILAYLDWVADKLDVRRAFRFNTAVTSLTWDDAQAVWTVGTADGRTWTARFVISCVGGLSTPKVPEFPGADTFGGELYWTSRWPHEAVDFTGKRVAVIGTGSSGIQVIPEIAKQAAHLTVFQRTANYAAPLCNTDLDPVQRRYNAAHHAELREGSRQRFSGAPYEVPTMPALAATPEQRCQVYDKYYRHGGFSLLTSTFTDLLFDEGANETIADYLRDRIRERVKDPATAELLCPTDHPYGTKRPPFETNYYETFNLPHVELVDVRNAPIEAITATGLETSGAAYDFDVIVLATGFDVYTRPQLDLGITGRDGLRLEDKWSSGPTSYLGIQIAGFPNLFTVVGPQSAAGVYNTPLLIEDHVDLVTAAIRRVEHANGRKFEATLEAERTWGALVEGLLNLTLFPRAKNSWYMGDNIPGKPRAAYLFAAGAPMYVAICQEIIHTGFAGFAVDGVPAPLSPLVRLEPAAAMTLANIMNSGAKPIAQCNLEEARNLIESFAQLQRPGPALPVASIENPRLCVYRPHGAHQRPVILFSHGGGFVAGSLDMVDPTCRRLANELDAVVVSIDYRLAPEHPYPAATDDTFAALEWTREHIAEHGGDPHRIAVMGESAGATLTAVLAQRARDANIELSAQVLLYPAIDPHSLTPSKFEFARGPLLPASAGDAFWKAYLGDGALSRYAAPSCADSLRGLAPALVLTAELDATRDEAENYADALSAAGVPTQLRRFNGLFHGVFLMSGFVPQVDTMYVTISQFLVPKLHESKCPPETRLQAIDAFIYE